MLLSKPVLGERERRAQKLSHRSSKFGKALTLRLFFPAEHSSIAVSPSKKWWRVGGLTMMDVESLFSNFETT